jgi:hypothetical protein
MMHQNVILMLLKWARPLHDAPIPMWASHSFDSYTPSEARRHFLTPMHTVYSLWIPSMMHTHIYIYRHTIYIIIYTHISIYYYILYIIYVYVCNDKNYRDQKVAWVYFFCFSRFAPSVVWNVIRRKKCSIFLLRVIFAAHDQDLVVDIGKT